MQKVKWKQRSSKYSRNFEVQDFEFVERIVRIIVLQILGHQRDFKAAQIS